MTRPARPEPETWAWIGADPLPYDRVLQWQEAARVARIAGALPDTVFWVVHLPTVTLGRRGRTAALLRSQADLEAHGVAVRTATRGGDVTYHGPGQWVMYPILKLGGAGADAHGHLWNLEELSIRVCADFEVEAWRRPGMSGAWTRAGKIAAIGFSLRRWVTMHGTSFNVDPQPNGFDWIVPCGLAGEPVASLRTLLGDAAPDMAAVADRMIANFPDVFGRPLRVFRPGDPLPPELDRVLSAGSEAPGGARPAGV